MTAEITGVHPYARTMPELVAEIDRLIAERDEARAERDQARSKCDRALLDLEQLRWERDEARALAAAGWCDATADLRADHRAEIAEQRRIGEWLIAEARATLIAIRHVLDPIQVPF